MRWSLRSPARACATKKTPEPLSECRLTSERGSFLPDALAAAGLIPGGTGSYGVVSKKYVASESATLRAKASGNFASACPTVRASSSPEKPM